ncbi:hypothetical protein BU080_12265 [Staphylococcus warneri]|uniref:Phage protein n=1 Tax=Staphylococcus warneri TaxID=1292 RepID=A0A2T4PXG9_STAWA|nr:hypothetical protein [Staphylococcus warneri]PTI22097.1 hypothetical protein BU080_12265 [Staphylococcus warneri]PTI49382.1 hypothetical protein BU085_12220 [Staphylococcus warneri]
MVKIKTKKEMTLPELIQWGWDNDVKNEKYICNQDEDAFVRFNSMSEIAFSAIYNHHFKDTYTVEVEEEITEGTKLDLVERFIGSMGSVCYTSHNMSIKECLKLNSRDCTTTHFYIENCDRELILIWCDGKMVD